MMQGIALTVEKISSHLKINELQKDIVDRTWIKTNIKNFLFIWVSDSLRLLILKPSDNLFDTLLIDNLLNYRVQHFEVSLRSLHLTLKFQLHCLLCVA